MFKNRIITSIFIFFVFLGFGNTQAQHANADQEIKKSLWKGFTRYDFRLDQRDVRLVFPEKALPGNPWLWRARFPDWHTDADSILVSEGFHLAYINTDNLYGSPAAMRAWDMLYELLTNKYKLNKKVALAGVSRGGLFVYTWAKQNPEKVNCIYAEAPVCDFKSWPAGFGKGLGSIEDWQKLKKAYGFVSDTEAKEYANNPLDKLKTLAKAKIPVLHMVGLNDEYVPAEENTFILVNRYIRLGGIATVVPCTQGKQELKGHHFPIETPRLVADFIKYNCLKDLPLESSDYHIMRNGIQNCRIQFERNKTGRVAFLGGSITYNPGWRDSICVYLGKRFPDTKFEFIAAGIPSMGSTPGAFRLERDVLSHGRIDLLFGEAAVNDATNGRLPEEQVRGMEGIVRHVRESNPAVDIVMMHFVDPDKMKDYRDGREPEVITNHNRVAEHYNIPVINLAKEVTDRIDKGEFTWEGDFKNLHPSPFGQGVYARSMIEFLEDAFSSHIDNDDKISDHPLPEKLDPFCYENGKLINIESVKLTKGWSIDPSWNPHDNTGLRPNYFDVPMLTGTPGKVISLKFKGTAVGIAVAAGQDAGMIEFRIDKGEWHKQNLYTRWSKHLHLPWYYTLSAELSPGNHKLEIRVSEEKDERSSGNACRIRYFFVNGD